MKKLEEKIRKDAFVKENNIIKVDSFLNHQLDVTFLDLMGKEIYNYFQNHNINKILTIEASGIALAVIAARYFGNIPVVFAKKAKSQNISNEVFFSTVTSYTYDKEYTVTVSKEFLNSEDHLLIIDDFLAEGNALKGLLQVANDSGAVVKGIAVGIEKGFQKGGKIIRDMGYDLLSLAIINDISEGNISFQSKKDV